MHHAVPTLVALMAWLDQGMIIFSHMLGHLSCCCKRDEYVKLNKIGLLFQTRMLEEQGTQKFAFVCIYVQMIDKPSSSCSYLMILSIIGPWLLFSLHSSLLVNISAIIYIEIWFIFYKPSILMISHCWRSSFCSHRDFYRLSLKKKSRSHGYSFDMGSIRKLLEFLRITVGYWRCGDDGNQGINCFLLLDAA